jgi:hypothetical protein
MIRKPRSSVYIGRFLLSYTYLASKSLRCAALDEYLALLTSGATKQRSLPHFNILGATTQSKSAFID